MIFVIKISLVNLIEISSIRKRRGLTRLTSLIERLMLLLRVCGCVSVDDLVGRRAEEEQEEEHVRGASPPLPRRPGRPEAASRLLLHPVEDGGVIIENILV